MQHLTPVLLVGMMVGGRLWVMVFLFPLLCWQLCLFPCFSERGKATIRHHSGVILCVSR